MENSSIVYLQSCHVLPQRETNSSHVGTASGTPDNFPLVMHSEHFGFSQHVSRSRCHRGRDCLECLITTWQAKKSSSRWELSAGYYSFATENVFTQWNIKAVLPADTTFVQINRIPVELCVCRRP